MERPWSVQREVREPKTDPREAQRSGQGTKNDPKEAQKRRKVNLEGDSMEHENVEKTM